MDEDADTETVETPAGTLSVETVERLAPTEGYYPVAGLAVAIAAVAVAASLAALAVALRERSTEG